MLARRIDHREAMLLCIDDLTRTFDRDRAERIAQVRSQIEDLSHIFDRDQAEKIAQVRSQIADGTYETPERLEIAAGRLLDDVIDNPDDFDPERWDGMS